MWQEKGQWNGFLCSAIIMHILRWPTVRRFQWLIIIMPVNSVEHYSPSLQRTIYLFTKQRALFPAMVVGKTPKRRAYQPNLPMCNDEALVSKPSIHHPRGSCCKFHTIHTISADNQILSQICIPRSNRSETVQPGHRAALGSPFKGGTCTARTSQAIGVAHLFEHKS